MKKGENIGKETETHSYALKIDITFTCNFCMDSKRFENSFLFTFGSPCKAVLV